MKAADHVHVTVPVPVASKVTDDDFGQATALWGIMGKQDGARSRFIDNLAAHISGVETKWLREEVYGRFIAAAAAASCLMELSFPTLGVMRWLNSAMSTFKYKRLIYLFLCSHVWESRWRTGREGPEGYRDEDRE